MSQPTDRLDGQVALVTGGGRGIGANIAHELADAGAKVAVAARTKAQVEEVASEIGGLALEVDVTDPAAVEGMVAETERELGPLNLLAANAGIGGPDGPTWKVDPDAWWQVLEVNVLGVHLCCSAVIPDMLERGSGRIVITGSGASYLPGARSTPYPTSKAAVGRYGETLANELVGHIPVFVISPGLVKTEMTGDNFSDDAPWTPPELAPRLVRVLASGRADALAGRYLHAEHDDIEDLIRRADEIREQDLNAIRLRRQCVPARPASSWSSSPPAARARRNRSTPEAARCRRSALAAIRRSRRRSAGSARRTACASFDARLDGYLLPVDARKLLGRAASTQKRLVVFPGGYHGWDLVTVAPYHARASRVVIDFLHRYG